MEREREGGTEEERERERVNNKQFVIDTIYNAIQHRLFPTYIEHNNITPIFVPNIGMGGKGVDRRRIVSWSTPNIN